MKALKQRRKVFYGVYRSSFKPHPVIRIRGKHLEKWGFGVGDAIMVAMEVGKITITKA